MKLDLSVELEEPYAYVLRVEKRSTGKEVSPAKAPDVRNVEPTCIGIKNE